MSASDADRRVQQDDVDRSGGVHRRAPLPLEPARGHLLVPEAVALVTQTAFRGYLGPDGRHEGIVFWAGRQDGDDQIIVAAVVPRAIHGRGFIHVSAAEVGEAAHHARTRRLALLAQVHSHPGRDTRHSDADDSLVLMAREAMFSIVVADYGDRGISTFEGAGIHQFQDGRWVQVSNANTSLIVVPAGILT
jgi:hypothetical protein